MKLNAIFRSDDEPTPEYERADDRRLSEGFVLLPTDLEDIDEELSVGGLPALDSHKQLAATAEPQADE